MPDEITQQPQVGAEQVKPAVEPAVNADEFDKDRAMATIEKLRVFEKQAKAYEKKLADYEQKEKERQDAELSETERLKKQLAEVQAANKAMERLRLQREVADKVGLPAAFANRLQGETPDELEADAKSILELLPKQGKQVTGNPTNPGANATGQGETNAQKLARIYGQDVDMFNPVDAKQHGGGVIYTTKSDT